MSDIKEGSAPSTHDGGAVSTKRGGSGLRRHLIEKEILERAAELFAQKGYAGTSLQDVADALGLSRPALYYYVRSKEAILEQLVQNLSQRDAKALDSIRRRRTGGPDHKLREMVMELAGNAGSHPRPSRILSENRHHLPEKLAAADRQAERTIVRSIESVIAEGIELGQFRTVKPRSAALAIIGMCLWTAWWIDEKDSTLDEVVPQIADQAVASVRVEHHRSAGRDDPQALLRTLREDLAQLERVIKP